MLMNKGKKRDQSMIYSRVSSPSARNQFAACSRVPLRGGTRAFAGEDDMKETYQLFLICQYENPFGSLVLVALANVLKWVLFAYSLHRPDVNY
jgi:hypothetical protein